MEIKPGQHKWYKEYDRVWANKNGYFHDGCDVSWIENNDAIVSITDIYGSNGMGATWSVLYLCPVYAQRPPIIDLRNLLLLNDGNGMQYSVYEIEKDTYALCGRINVTVDDNDTAETVQIAINRIIRTAEDTCNGIISQLSRMNIAISKGDIMNALRAVHLNPDIIPCS